MAGRGTETVAGIVVAAARGAWQAGAIRVLFLPVAVAGFGRKLICDGWHNGIASAPFRCMTRAAYLDGSVAARRSGHASNRDPSTFALAQGTGPASRAADPWIGHREPVVAVRLHGGSGGLGGFGIGCFAGRARGDGTCKRRARHDRVRQPDRQCPTCRGTAVATGGGRRLERATAA